MKWKDKYIHMMQRKLDFLKNKSHFEEDIFTASFPTWRPLMDKHIQNMQAWWSNNFEKFRSESNPWNDQVIAVLKAAVNLHAELKSCELMGGKLEIDSLKLMRLTSALEALELPPNSECPPPPEDT